MHDQDREMQIELLAIQVKQQHISTFYSTLLSVEISVMLALVVFYAGLYNYLGNPFFAWLTFFQMVFLIPIAITWYQYQKEMRKFEKELERLRKKYLFY